MKLTLLAVLPALLMAGCATPFDDRSDAGVLPPTRNGELPRWVTDEWESSQGDHSTAHSRSAAKYETALGASHDDALRPTSLDDLILAALANNPSVQAAEARWHAARHRIVQARTLPEPQLSYRVIVEQIDTERDPIAHAVGISQMFPWFGTLDRAADIKAAEARAAAQRFVQQQFAVVSAVKSAWAEYAYLHQAAAVYREQLDLLQQTESVVRSRFRTGEVGQRDLVRAEAEIDRVENDLRDAQEMIIASAARLNAAIGRPTNAVLPSDPQLPSQDIDINAEELIETLLRINPSLEGLRHQLAARRHAQQLADKQFYPDIMLGIEYGVNTAQRMADNERRAGRPGGGTDMLMGRIGVTLPIWRDSYEAGVREALAEWGATLREIDDRQNTLEAELKMTVYGIHDAQRRMDLFGDRLRIRAEQVLESTLTAYRSDEASFTDFIEAQRELLEFSLAAHRAEADRFAQMARLEEIVGTALDSGIEEENTQENRP